MTKEKRTEKKAWMAGFLIVFLTLLATPVVAKSISLKGIGAVPIIAIAIGIVIILLQLIPAMILFFSFVGTLSAMAFKGRKIVEEAVDKGAEAIGIPRCDPMGLEHE